MREAVIVSTARTPLSTAYHGLFNNTQPQTLSAHVLTPVANRAKIDPKEIEDVARYSVVTKYDNGGMRAAGLFEIFE
ncbi:hypothetical protein [Sneathiella sp.]|uniref:thiolase family protein n=1 Tax=Sneathiella sp. TaxID=1964365 RepID=UPI0035612AD8